MEVKKTVAQRLVELLRMTTDQLREQLTISRGYSLPEDDTRTSVVPLPEKVRQEIIEAELESGEISE
jgi:hypothetical protein